MALGEYVSVSSQRDSERALIAKENRELREMPEEELEELTALYRDAGLTDATARQVAVELTAHDALAAHLEVELHIDQDDWSARGRRRSRPRSPSRSARCCRCWRSCCRRRSWRVPVTFVAVLIALALTGTVSAHLGGSSKVRAIAAARGRRGARPRRHLAIGTLLGTTGRRRRSDARARRASVGGEADQETAGDLDREVVDAGDTAPSTVTTTRLRIATIAANAITCGRPTKAVSETPPSEKLWKNSSTWAIRPVVCTTM